MKCLGFELFGVLRMCKIIRWLFLKKRSFRFWLLLLCGLWVKIEAGVQRGSLNEAPFFQLCKGSNPSACCDEVFFSAEHQVWFLLNFETTAH